MKKFEEWIIENHPEAIEEGWMKNLAIGGALLGTGMGVGGMMQSPKQTQQPQQVQQIQQKPTMNAWQHKKAEMARQKAELQRKTQGLTDWALLQKRTFTQGQADKEIESSSATSDDAADFLPKSKPSQTWTNPNAADFLK